MALHDCCYDMDIDIDLHAPLAQPQHIARTDVLHKLPTGFTDDTKHPQNAVHSNTESYAGSVRL